MYFIGTIWGPAFDFKEEILEFSKDFAEVITHKELKLDEDYNCFVRDMYAQERMDPAKIEGKIAHMQSSKKSVELVLYKINTKNIAYHPFKKENVFADVERLKNEIRKTYKNKIPDYFFDNVFHLTDSFEEYRHTLSVLEKYIDKDSELHKENIPNNLLFRTTIGNMFINNATLWGKGEYPKAPDVDAPLFEM